MNIDFISKKTKVLIVASIIIILITALIVRIVIIMSDLRRNIKSFENKDALNFYATTLFIKPFSLLADKYSILQKKKIAIIFDYDKREISDIEKRNCYILSAKRPNIFLQNYISEEDYMAINMQIGAIVNNNDDNIQLGTISELINFIDQNKMTLILNANSTDIKDIIINWYKRYIVDNICQSIASKIVPLHSYSIGDINYKQAIISLKDNNYNNKYNIKFEEMYLISNENINVNKIIYFLHKNIDLIFADSNDVAIIKNNLQDLCQSHYLNNDFANMLNNMESKDLLDKPLLNNEVAIGPIKSVINSGKLIYSSSNKEDITTWLIASGQNKTECYEFFNFIKQNNALLNQYGLISL
jgi:hypothetical protein